MLYTIECGACGARGPLTRLHTDGRALWDKGTQGPQRKLPVEPPTYPVVYVAGKFRGPNAWTIECNIRNAEHVGMLVAQAGGMPLIPHANTRFFHGTMSDEFWLEGTIELLRRCDALITVADWRESVGAKAEVAEAERLNIPIFHNATSLHSWIDNRAEAVNG